MKINYNKWIRFLIVILVIFGMNTINGCVTRRVSIKRTYHPGIPVKTDADRSMKNIRVALIRNARFVSISAIHDIGIYDMATRKKVGTIAASETSQWRLSGDRIIEGRRFFDAKEIRLVPAKNDYLKINDHHYRGQITLVKAQSGTLMVINILPMDDYIQGVVPNEVPAKWPMEALKAQAVIARTFAIYKMSGRKLKTYDLDASVNSQVYRGLDSEQVRTNRAVQTTTGLIVSNQSKVIAAFYHSNCGGRTADVKNVWGSDIPYLKGTKCGFCNNGPHFKWSYKIKQNNLEKLLRSHSYPVKGLKQIRLIGRDISNRVREVELIHKKGRLELKSAPFRMMIGADKLRSTNFYVERKGPFFIFEGHGWGHGVGFCQEGAMAMADSGYDFKTIIIHYYPGVSIVQLGK